MALSPRGILVDDRAIIGEDDDLSRRSQYLTREERSANTDCFNIGGQMYTPLPDIFWYLGLFIVALVGFHVLFNYWRPLSALTWRKVDYVWLVISVFAIVAAGDQLRIIDASDQIARNKSGWNDRTATQIQNTKETRQSLCEGGANPDAKGCAWYDQAIAAMEKAGQVSSQWRDLSLSPTNQLRSDFKIEADIKSNIIETLRDEAVTRTELESVISREDLQGRIPLIVSLLLLPIALALRIAKVSAEIRIARQNG